MGTQYKIINATPGGLMRPRSKDIAGTPALTAYLGRNLAADLLGNQQVTNTFQSYLPGLDGLLTNLAATAGKQSFLGFKHNKYITVPTANIALFILNMNQDLYTRLTARSTSSITRWSRSNNYYLPNISLGSTGNTW